MDNFTPVSALLGGALIGLSASMMLLFNGRIAGISGVFSGLLAPRAGDVGWRATFVAGLLAGGVALALLAPSVYGSGGPERSIGAVIVAGLLVGVGTRLGNGCTSGHGICGLTRLSPRSAVAVGTFMATGFITAAIVTQVFGGVI